MDSDATTASSNSSSGRRLRTTSQLIEYGIFTLNYNCNLLPRLQKFMPLLWSNVPLLLTLLLLVLASLTKSTLFVVASTTETNAQLAPLHNLHITATNILKGKSNTTTITSSITTTTTTIIPTKIRREESINSSKYVTESASNKNNLVNSSSSSTTTTTINSISSIKAANEYELLPEIVVATAVGAYTAASIYDAQSDNLLKTNNNSNNITNVESHEIQLPPLHTILVSIILLLVILGTVVGNVLVCIAVCMVRKLRRPCNYLLVSLALSDLCVAVLVMPIALLYEVLEKWNFGTIVCDVWVSFDVLCCTASILNLCAISVDRYLAITKPLEYGVKRTPRRMMLCVALVWLGAACISLPPLLILGNEHFSEDGEPICNVCQQSGYQIYATLGSFYIPLSVMLFVYYQIFRAARRIVLEEKRAQTHLQHALNGTGSPATTTDLCGTSSSAPLHIGGTGGNGHRHSSYGNTSLTYSAALATQTAGSSCVLGSPHQKKLRFQLAKEKKASTTLGIIMSAFTICWLPFFILALIRPFVESTSYHVPQSITSLFLWLGYANSLLNPIIYATLNRDFRKPFQEILYFRCSSLNTMMRENYYHDQYGEPPSQRVMLGDERHGARESFL